MDPDVRLPVPALPCGALTIPRDLIASRRFTSECHSYALIPLSRPKVGPAVSSLYFGAMQHNVIDSITYIPVGMGSARPASPISHLT